PCTARARVTTSQPRCRTRARPSCASAPGGSSCAPTSRSPTRWKAAGPRPRHPGGPGGPGPGQAAWPGPLQRLPVTQNLAESLTSAGRWDEVLDVIEEALGLDPAPYGRAFLLVLRGQIAVARGEQETAAWIMQQLRLLPAGAQDGSQLALPMACLTVDFWLA